MGVEASEISARTTMGEADCSGATVQRSGHEQQWENDAGPRRRGRIEPPYFTRVFRLSFLAPEITKAIIQGRQPDDLSAIKLMGAGQFADSWSQQRRQLGFN